MRYDDATAAADIIRYAPFGAPLSLMPNITTHSSLLLITCRALPGSPEGREAIFCIPSGKGYVNPNVMASLFDVELPETIFFMVQ